MFLYLVRVILRLTMAVPWIMQAGLFSGVGASFIVNLESTLIPNQGKMTNVLLMVLINKIDNGTFPDQDIILPVPQGLSYTQIWIQTLAHASLSTSLLAAFGAVLAKQWLGHYKTSRFGRGALHERCKQRHQKLDGLKNWHFSAIVSTLPIFLQLSLLFFGIALSTHLWIQEHTISTVIIATTAVGIIFYSYTVLESLTSPDCPFQTPVSVMVTRLTRKAITFGTTVRQKWDQRPKSWASVNGLLSSVRTRLEIGQHAVVRSITRVPTYFTRILSALTCRGRVQIIDPERESARGAEHSSQPAGDLEKHPDSDKLFLDYGESPVEFEVAEVHAVQWVLEKSTDTDIITTAAKMVPEIEWPHEVSDVLDRLNSHLYASFDPARQLPLLAQERAVACVKAICHLYSKQGEDPPFIIDDGDIYSYDDHYWYQMHGAQGFLLISCAVSDPGELDITRLTLSERMWMAHMFTYRLRDDKISPKAVPWVLEFICVCLLGENPPGRLVADCLLLAGLLMGLKIDRQQLGRLDKR
jgi:Family of unknown function (DUF6535)